MHMAESNILMRGLRAGNKSANGIESGVQGLKGTQISSNIHLTLVGAKVRC